MMSRTTSLTALAALALLIAGCSKDPARSEESARSDGDAAKRRFSEKATADVTAANVLAGLEARDRDEDDGGFQPFSGFLPLAEAGATGCADIDEGKSSGSCTCSAGGSLDYATSDIQGLVAQKPGPELSLAVDYKDCKTDSDALTGKLVVVQSYKPIIDRAAWLAAGVDPARSGDESSSPSSPGAANRLWHAEKIRATYLKDGTTRTIDYAILAQGGERCLRASVESGFYYVCRGDRATQFAVHANNGSFTCDRTTNECTSSDGTTKFDIEIAAEPKGSDGGAN